MCARTYACCQPKDDSGIGHTVLCLAGKRRGVCSSLLNSLLSDEDEITIKIPLIPKGIFLKDVFTLSLYSAQSLLLRKSVRWYHTYVCGLMVVCPLVSSCYCQAAHLGLETLSSYHQFLGTPSRTASRQQRAFVAPACLPPVSQGSRLLY